MIFFDIVQIFQTDLFTLLTILRSQMSCAYIYVKRRNTWKTCRMKYSCTCFENIPKCIETIDILDAVKPQLRSDTANRKSQHVTWYTRKPTPRAVVVRSLRFFSTALAGGRNNYRYHMRSRFSESICTWYDMPTDILFRARLQKDSNLLWCNCISNIFRPVIPK